MPTCLARPVRSLVATAVLTTSIVAIPSSAGAQSRAHAPPDPVEAQVEQVLTSVGVAWGTVANSWDLERGAEVLGIELEVPDVPHTAARKFGLDPMDVWRELYVARSADAILQAHRQRLAEPAWALGIDVGTTVDDADVRRVAEATGLDVGRRVDAMDVHHVTLAAKRQGRVATEVMAVVGGLEVHVPGHDVRAIGFHEAPSGGQRRAAMQIQNPLAFVMPSRGRSTPATSAVDVAMPRGTDVIAPVTGVVTEVVHYTLYGKHRDAYIRIRSGRHDVMVLHVEGVTVGVGNRVEAGVTKIADGPRTFPFDSQVEEFAGRFPHVDVSVRPVG